MKVMRIHSYGGPEVMQLEELALPEPGPDEVRIRVVVAGVNFSDITLRRAPLPFFSTKLPLSLGNEGAGIVEAVGSAVTTVRVGDRVAWGSVRGSYATQVLASAQHLFSLPDVITFEQAASLITQGSMAHILSHAVYPLTATDRCLIQTIAGGVGLLLCQMAKACGAFVIGTTSTAEKAREAYAAGADHVIIYTQADVESEVKHVTQGRGVNVVYDAVGKDTFDKNLNCLAVRGSFVLYGAASGPVPPINVLTLAEKGSLFLTRVIALHYMSPEEQFQRVQDLFSWVAEGVLRPRIGQRYALADAVKAHEDLERGQTVGKLLLFP